MFEDDDYYDNVPIPDEETLENMIIDPYYKEVYFPDPYTSMP